MGVSYFDSINSTAAYNSTGFDGINSTIESDECPDEDNYQTFYLTFRVTVDVFIVGSLCLFGILGNIISMVVIKSGKITSAKTTRFLLQGLSISDSSYLIMAFISSTMRGIMKYTDWGDPFHGRYPYMYRYIWALSAIARLLAVNFVVLVTIERYIATCHPLNVKRWCTLKRVRIVAAITVLVSMLFNVPRFFDAIPVEYDNCTKMLDVGGYAEYLELNGMFYSMAYITVLYYTANVIIPITLLLILNAKIIITLKRAFRGVEALGSSFNHRAAEKTQAKEKGTTMMLCVVVIVFIVCQTPSFAISMVYTLYAFGVNMPDRNMMRYWYSIGTTLNVLNSATNFGIYFVFSKQFRQVLMGYLSCIKCISCNRGKYTCSSKKFEKSQQSTQSTSSSVERYLSNSSTRETMIV
ncbi:unnamed protein product [Owenia fusiformis]|uniref:Uncharacterized protein n=1 Tax=Owenia fusiformis TaxID=6347 RepID=A0A8J1UH16_OWEFU|nr:unnamed protein product [Owenia fusiformis]